MALTDLKNRKDKKDGDMAQAMSFSEKGEKYGTFTVEDTDPCLHYDGLKRSLGEIKGDAAYLRTLQRRRCDHGYL